MVLPMIYCYSKLRVKMGLKPLQVEGSSQPDNESEYLYQA